jgi:pimeloyl-ACP methyl ester carboxylesterase
MAYWTAADNTRIYYEQDGSADGPWLLLLPGLLGSVQSQWQRFAAILRQTHRLLMVDLRGHGFSENNDSWLAPDVMVRDLLGILDALDIKAIHVSGYSLGGYLGLMLALSSPLRVKSLLLHAVKFYWTADTLRELQSQLNPDTLVARAPKYATRLAEIHGARQWRPLSRQASDLTGYLAMKGLDDESLAMVSCPVLVSVGDRDEMVPVGEALRLYRALPDGRLMVLPEVRHPFHSITPLPFLPMMKTFHR